MAQPVYSLDITGCSNITQEGQTYVLTENILNSDYSICMNITANNVILDCQGHKINASSGNYGVYVFRETQQDANVTIKNCIVEGWNNEGIHVQNANKITIYNTSVSSSVGNGIYISVSDYSNITLVNSTYNRRGIYLLYSTGTVLENLNLLENDVLDFEIASTSATDCMNTLIDVTGTDNKPIVYFNDSVTIKNWNNNVSEIVLCSADYSTIENVTMIRYGTENNGIVLVNTDHTNITNVTINKTDKGVFIVRFSDFNRVSHSRFYSCYSGVYIGSSANNNTIENNNFSGNRYSIRLFQTANETIINNRVERSVNYGIFIEDDVKNLTVYNNLFNNTNNIYFSGTIYANEWNTTRQIGSRIYSDGIEIGGNYWTNPSGTGYSDICNDNNNDGFCDKPYNLTSETTTATFQYGVGGYTGTEDTSIDNHYKDGNYGSNGHILMTSYTEGLIKFNISSIPDNAIITSVRLYVTMSTDSGTTATYRLWNMTTTDWTESGATWNKKDGTNSWASGSFSSADYDVYLDSSFTSSDSAGTQRYFPSSSKLVAYVQNQLSSGEVNFRIEHYSGDPKYFYSKDYSTASYRPKLEITYYDKNIDYLPLSSKYSNQRNISSCSELNENGITYTLTQNISDSSDSVCMHITADNVTLDCQGHKIDGIDSDSSYGIKIENAFNVTLRNCVVSDWYYGIYLYNTKNSTIDGVNITSNSYGINLTTNSSYNIIKDSNISNNQKDGVYIYKSDKNTIYSVRVYNNSYNGIWAKSSDYLNFTRVTSYSNGYDGINLSYSDNATMSSIEVYSNYNGISLHSCKENTILYVTSHSNEKFGARIEYSSNNSINSFNSSFNVGDYAVGLYIFESHNNSFYNITADENGNAGIVMINSDRNTMHMCQANHNFWAGIAIQNSLDSNFTLCRVEYNMHNGVKFAGGERYTENILKDSVVRNSHWDYDIYGDIARHESNIYLINVTFDKSYVRSYEGWVSPVLWVKWYLDVVVKDGEGNYVSGATVEINDTFQNTVYSGVTNSTGSIERQILTEFNQTSSGKNYYTNYTINASKYIFSNSSDVNLTTNKLVTIQVQSPPAPQLTVKTFSAGLIEKYTFRAGRLVRVRAYVTTPMGREYLENATISIKSSNGSAFVDKDLMENISQIENGYLYEYNFTLPYNANGVWTINVTANDEIKTNSSDVHIAVSSLTMQIKFILNSTNDNIYIPGTGELTFQGLTSNEYITNHYYISSYSNDLLKSIVFSSGTPLSLITERMTNKFAIGINEWYYNSMIFVVFSKGDWRNIDNKIHKIETMKFLDYPKPTFSFGLGNEFPVKIIILGRFNLTRGFRMGRGYARIVIEKTGNDVNGRPLLSVSR
ncbi:MAG: right-handed parallel beta-helix repeat-containing protein [Candidatus Aenigmarchaeota archaeon]|nr:right-handed parallel beta-helix repeat-containing protein [Candidatus Aenigmarchaeota archaeon]